MSYAQASFTPTHYSYGRFVWCVTIHHGDTCLPSAGSLRSSRFLSYQKIPGAKCKSNISSINTSFTPSLVWWRISVVYLLLDYSMQHSMHISRHSLGIPTYIQVTALWDDVPNFCGLVTKRSKSSSAQLCKHFCPNVPQSNVVYKTLVSSMTHSRCTLRKLVSNVMLYGTLRMYAKECCKQCCVYTL
jgi:hypothetical protein